MSESRISTTVRALLYLSACALHGREPDQAQLAGVDLAALCRTAKYHGMAAIVCMALESGGAFQNADPALVKQWQDEKNKSIRKNLLLDAESGQILQYMEDNAIWHMSLKGSVLQQLYPQYGMRQMADHDILFDPAFGQQMQAYMQGRGYKAEGVGKGNHDAYHKPPVYNIELHRALFDTLANPVWGSYYSDVKRRLLPDEGCGCGYHFSDEDFYIYITAHACKHYQGGGTGLRSLMDCYVYCWKKGDALDWDYIEAELEKLEISGFERQCRELGTALFSEPSLDAVDHLTEEQREVLGGFADAGTYGTLKLRVERRLRSMQRAGRPVDRRTRWGYYWSRLVPDMSWFQTNEPFCWRHRWAIPFFLIFRLFRGLILRGGRIRNEIQIVRNTKE